MPRELSGFSKLTKEEKVNILVQDYLGHTENDLQKIWKSFWISNPPSQAMIESFSENTISNFHLPYGVAPHFLINGEEYIVPMVIEESSVVAASSSSAKFWKSYGGFQAEVISTKKRGQIHFYWDIKPQLAEAFFNKIKDKLLMAVSDQLKGMVSRGGGICDLKLIDQNKLDHNYFQIEGIFETCDAMGANIINTVLEEIKDCFEFLVQESHELSLNEKNINVIMAILSNYNPESLVKVTAQCPISKLKFKGVSMGPEAFAQKFQKAIHISKIDISRATTHNKGIFNGVDAVAIATGNDFRAIEACGHTYAAKDGKYKGLTDVSLDEGVFKVSLTLPLSVGTVGGLTRNHPLAQSSLTLLKNPDAKKLMEIIASVGLAQNFAAVKSLITTGIQQGHMKLHMKNILNDLNATDEEIKRTYDFFSSQKVSYWSIKQFIRKLRNTKNIH